MNSVVVIPTYNEKENIKLIIEKIFKLGENIQILVVDDNSPDGTSDLVEEYSKFDNRVLLMKRSGKLGLGSAYREGFRRARSLDVSYIFEMDADFSHDPQYIPDFLNAIKDADVVIGSRYIRGVNVVNWPMKRLLLSYFANVYANTITGMNIRDCTGGFKCFRKEVLQSINLDKIRSEGYAFQMEMNFRCWKAGFRIKEIPIIFTERREGISKMSREVIKEAIWMVWRLRFENIF